MAKGETITIKVDDKLMVQWTQPADWAGTGNFPALRIRQGTITLQGHGPGSRVYYKNIRIRFLE